MSSTSNSSDTGHAAESNDLVPELIPPIEASPEASQLLRRDSSIDSGTDTRRESCPTLREGESSSDIRRPSVADEPGSSGQVTQDPSRHTSIDQGYQEGTSQTTSKDQSTTVHPTLTKQDSSDRESSDGGNSDPLNPVVSEDTNSGQAEGPSRAPSLHSCDLPEIVSESDPSRSEGPPRTGMDSAIRYSSQAGIVQIPMSTTPDSASPKPEIEIIPETPDVQVIPGSPGSPEQSGQATSITSAGMESRSNSSFPPRKQARVQAPSPQPPRIESYNDIMFTLSKLGVYLFGVIYLTGLYFDFWLTKQPFSSEALGVGFVYLCSLFGFGIFCFVDRIRVSNWWIILCILVTVAFQSYFCYQFQANENWWFSSVILHVICMMIYFVSHRLDSNATDLMLEWLRYRNALSDHEVVVSPETMTLLTDNNAEQGEAGPSGLSNQRTSQGADEDELSSGYQVTDVRVN